jgi:hypothetical protein
MPQTRAAIKSRSARQKIENCESQQRLSFQGAASKVEPPLAFEGSAGLL